MGFMQPFILLVWLLSTLTIGSLAALCFRRAVAIEWMEPLVPAYRFLLRVGFLLIPLVILFCFFTQPVWPEKIQSVAYVSIWTVMALTCRRIPSGVGFFYVVVLLFSASFAAYNWFGVLHPSWHSTGFGLVCLASAVLFTFSIANLLAGAANKERLNKINNVHWALLCSWCYVTFTQFLIVWSGDRPEEASWYLSKTDFFSFIPIILTVQFTVAFLCLCFVSIKRSRLATKALSWNSAIMQFLFIIWMIGGAP